jgi:hypothetical protein
MGFLFLDIESFVDPKDERSGLNPHHSKSRVIVIAYNYYSFFKAPNSSQIKAPTFLFGWKYESEETLLMEFYKILKDIYQKDSMLKVIGFNHLAYDLPFLFSRMVENDVAEKKELFDALFSLPRHIDLAQLGMPISEFTKKEEDFRCISQKTINSYFNIPVKEDSGKDLTKFYLEKDFARIEKYCMEEFTFELLYQSVLSFFLA